MPRASEPAALMRRARGALLGSEIADLGTWPRRRWLRAAGIAVAAVIALVAAGGIGGLVGQADAALGIAPVAPWWTLPAIIVGSALVALIVTSYLDPPIGADATLCDTRWPVLGLIGLYLATELRSLQPVLEPSSLGGAVRPVVALAAITLLLWALRQRLVAEHRATAALDPTSDPDAGEACTTCRPLFAHRAAPAASATPAASASPTTESHP